MRLFDVFGRRIRGFRVLDVAALAIVLALALTVYALKTSAGRERAEITDVETKIGIERRNIRLLTSEVARLESPDRMERLARAYAGQAPVEARQEVTAGSLPMVASPGGPS